ncbi:MAG TPA: iron ABC transporter permease [Candidatus Xenobia bacterium]|nr:iron ABC transporter permease [Candidatus Xenobia bacterium]
MTAAVLTRTHIVRVCLTLSGVLFLLSFAALLVGAADLPAKEVGAALWSGLTGADGIVSMEHRAIVLNVRLPRILLAIIVGAALSVAGAGYQALLRNPLADPFVLGVSSGAALGALFSLFVASVLAPAAAFLGALATIAAVYYLGQRRAELAPYTLLLAGIVVASFLSGLIVFLLYWLSGRDLRGFVFWLMGDLSNPPAPMAMLWLGLVILGAIAAVYYVAGDLNLLLSGETEAEALGVNVRRTKMVVYLAASLATGLAVSVSGSIGYVGLLVPHLVRLIFGSDYRLLVPAAALSGAVVMVAADTLARTVLAPSELPVGAVMALAGAPVFIYLLRTRLAAGAEGAAR